MRPNWVPDLFHFYTGIKRASTTFINYFCSRFYHVPSYAHPFGCIIEENFYTGAKQASTTFITFFNFFLGGYFTC